MIQEVEYEWKPPYCRKCNTVGHECKKTEKQPKKKQEPKKVWEHKKNLMVTTITLDTAPNEKPTESQPEPERPWIVVTNRNKGKAPTVTIMEEHILVGGFNKGESS